MAAQGAVSLLGRRAFFQAVQKRGSGREEWSVAALPSCRNGLQRLAQAVLHTGSRWWRASPGSHASLGRIAGAALAAGHATVRMQLGFADRFEACRAGGPHEMPHAQSAARTCG